MIRPDKLARHDIPDEVWCDHLVAVDKALNAVFSVLPHTNDYPIWTDGEEILCENEDTAERIGDLIDMMCGEQTVNTGYYDPAEDERNNEVDSHTGFHYVTIN